MGSKVLAFSTRSTDKPRVGRQRLSPGSVFVRPMESVTAASPPPPFSRSERGLRIRRALVLAGGIVLFFVLVARVGVSNVLANLQMVGWGILLVIAAEILAFIQTPLAGARRFRAERACHPSGNFCLPASPAMASITSLRRPHGRRVCSRAHASRTGNDCFAGRLGDRCES